MDREGPVRVLAVDTTSQRESVALVEGGVVRGEVRLEAVDAHSRRLVPAIAFLLEGLGLAASDVEGYAVASGPGSFTGLRVGLSTVQGLALASGRPCLGLSVLDVLAALIRGMAPHLIPLVDAYRGDVFGALYDQEARPLSEPRAGAAGSFLQDLTGGVALVGDGALRYRSEILAVRPEASFPERSLFLAGELGRLAEPRLVAGEAVAPGDLRPLYLRPPDIRGARP